MFAPRRATPPLGALLLAVAFTLALVPLVPARAADAPADVVRARAFAGKQDWRAARAVLVGAVAARPDDRGAQELLGFVNMKLLLFDEACEAFARGDEKDRYHDVNMGFCLRKAGRLVEALAAFQRAQRTIAKTDTWAQYCADQIQELEPLGKAAAVLCVAQADDFVVVALNGKIQGRVRAGVEQGFILDGKWRPGKNELRCVAVNTADTWAYRVRLYLGGKLVHSSGAGYAGKGTPAFEGDRTVGIIGETFLDVDPEGAAPRLLDARESIDFAKVQELQHRSEDLWRAARYGEAIQIYEAGGKDYPSLDWFHLRLAEGCEEIALTLQDVTTEAASKRERLRKAGAAARDRWIDVRKKVAQLSGDDAGAWHALASASSSVGRAADAEAAFKRALSYDPGRVEAMVGLADALVKQKKGAEAREWAEKAIERVPHYSAAHCLLGDALFEAGDSPAALASYQKAVDLDPTQGEWIFAKIAAAMNRGGANAGEIKEAARAATEARGDAKAHRAYGDALLRGLRYEEAVRSYSTAAAIDPRLSAIQPKLGLCFELTGKREKALEAYRKGSEDPDEALASLSRRRAAHVEAVAKAPARSYQAPPSGSFDAASGDGKAAATAHLASIRVVRPTLAEALLALPALRDGTISAADAEALERIQKLAQFARAKDDLRKAFLIMEREHGRRRGPPVPDGDLSEWQPKELLAEDPRGDAPSGVAGADLSGAYAVVTGEACYVALTTHGAARLSRGCAYWVHIYSPRKEKPWAAVGIEPSGVSVWVTRPDGSRKSTRGEETGVLARVSDAGVELSMPLSWVGGERRLQVEAYSLGGERLDTVAAEQPPVAIDEGYSPSLAALFDIASAVALESQDAAALAVAIDAGSLYALSDPALTAAVAEDARALVDLSRKVRAWQRSVGVTPLDQLPLAALLFWANRCVQWRPTDTAEYLRHAVSPATLEGMWRFAQARGWRGRAAGDLVEPAERWLMEPQRWQYTSYEMVARGMRARAGENVTLSETEKKELNRFVRDVTIDGRRMNTDGTFPPGLQFDYLVASDMLLGHCGNLAQTTVDFARAVGIPATIVQGIEEQSRLYQNPHAFPIYYDGAGKAWRSQQGRKYKGIRPLTLFFFLPALQPLAGARPTGGGSYYFPVATTYDETGPTFAAGYEPAWLEPWVKALGSAPR